MNATFPFGEITSYTARDGQRLVLRHFPHAAPAAHVVLLHGIVSHSGWYLQCASALVQQGFELHVLDRRGSGLNHDRAGDVDHYQTWIDDIVSYLESLPKDKPIILLGISWGGKIAPVIARLRPDLVKGIGLICPGIYARQQPGVIKRSLMQMANWFGLGRRKVWIPLRDPSLFTDGLPWREYIRQDPLSLRQITLRFAREDRRLTVLSRKSAVYLHTPSLLVLAGRDRMVYNDKTRRYFERVPALHKAVLEYPNAAHTLEFEPDPSVFFDDLAMWLHRTASRLG